MSKYKHQLPTHKYYALLQIWVKMDVSKHHLVRGNLTGKNMIADFKNTLSSHIRVCEFGIS